MRPRPSPVADGCGTCERCIPACPTGAIVAPGTVDARRCLSWSLQVEGPFPMDQRVALGDRIYGCDDCQEVCPPNRAESSVAGAGRQRRAGGHSAARTGRGCRCSSCSAASDEDLLARHGRWYIPDRDPRYLRRNALVVLGNVGDGADPAVRQVAPAATSRRPDPLLRAHAVWSARRLGCDDLLVDLQRRPRPRGAGRAGGPGDPAGSGVKHLLVTNDFPPKIGGIQSYLWELWRRLPADEAAVLTTPYAGRGRRSTPPRRSTSSASTSRSCSPRPLVRRIDETAARLGAELVLLDPALPLGHARPSARRFRTA